MKVRINGLKKGLVSGGEGPLEAVGVSMDPDRRYAVAELLPKELFVAIRITGCGDDELTGDYVNHFLYDNDVPMLLRFTVDWHCIKYGFCKLELWAPELANDFGGSFEKTVKRFYFDWELYKACYEEINGVPCGREDPNAE